MEQITFAALIAARIEAKRAEDVAISARREIDAQLAARLAIADKVEGAVSHKTDGFKVTVTYGLTRKVDTDALTKSWQALPAAVRAVFRWKADVSVTELKKLDAPALAAAATFITTSPASPQIRIEAV